jgi:hypothetical protein
MSHYEIVDCVWRGEERWHLEEPASLDGAKTFTWSFTRCQPFALRVPLRIGIQEEGSVVDFTFAAFDIPVLSPRAVEILSSPLAEFCEFVPVEVVGQPSGFAILNVLRAEDCVDERASELVIWKPTDARPDKAGQYRQVTKLVLKPDLRVPPIFRLAKFKIKLLVSDAVAEVFRRHRLSGVVLEEK